jgi:protein involved in polysaccharide export with SLBB domain
MRIALSTLFSLLVLCGCMSRREQALQAERTLAPGDCIIVDGAHRDHTVGPEHHHVIDSAGDISLFLLGRFHVAGLTLRQAQERIEKEYFERGFYRHIEWVVLLCP